MKNKILVVEDDVGVRSFLLDTISGEGYNPVGVASAEEAINRVETENFDIIVTDIQLPGKSGLELLPVCRRLNPQAYLLVMTGYGTVDNAVQAMKLGASDFLCKPININQLISAIELAADKAGQTPAPVTESSLAQSPIIAKSQLMLRLIDEVKTIAPYKINVLITGETGTGKELVARAIHSYSPRARRDFVALNCAAVPEQLLEDELFGHVKGAFTGAQTDRKGRFEMADAGTLFLDEIGDMNLALQSKLLRVLQESEFEKLGSSKTVRVDVRVIAATSANIDKKIADLSFRADLYHRLNVVHLRVPPLRERPDDIMPIAEGLLERFCRSTGLPAKTIDESAVHALISYSYPGNVRQLQNAMERAAIFSGSGDKIRLEHLPEEFKIQSNMFQIPAGNGYVPASIPDEGIDFSGVVSQLERELLLQTLEKTGGNKMQAAKLLNMKRTTLVEKIKRLQINVEDEDSDDDNTVSIAG